jgi:hypothetical protein
VEYRIEGFDYGMREFAVRDNSGYVLQFCRHMGKTLQDNKIVLAAYFGAFGC